MIQWQFLIQKEGDQDWLPLESPNVEILEGRYYLMARTDGSSVPVEVQIRHEYELEGVLQEVTQRRRQNPDSQGLLELLGLTYLPPGLWEIRCQTAQSEHSPEHSPQKLFLQVLAQDFELLSDWAVPELALDEIQHLRAATSSDQPLAATAPAVHQIAQQVRLPLVPREIVPLALRLSDPLCLPPMIYQPSPSAQSNTGPQLPDFLPSSDLLGNLLTSDLIPLDPPVPMESPLAFLGYIAKSTNRQEAYKAFESLARRQRFLDTLNTLAQELPAAQELVPT
jgi:hypothetical protein